MAGLLREVDEAEQVLVPTALAPGGDMIQAIVTGPPATVMGSLCQAGVIVQSTAAASSIETSRVGVCGAAAPASLRRV
ncbi:hypothetical protein [Microterricola viridarii]|uniref:Uncharacterized protein n=1 Tax=Microterricola viridarii TaxID=412690 RepID=A0A109QWE7_9MICO|nr:hypothetical protein [Microterricola viridarii]AMB57828.1 hypothetical protein AWU67_01935 [Microterricola viridarii]